MDWESGGVTYRDVVAFFKVDEAFGGLSNMAGGYPLRVSGILIPSSEALYQTMRFSDQPDIQREIITQKSPMSAKLKAKKDQRRERLSRADWEQVRLDVMRWCLRVKLAQHFSRVYALLRDSGCRAIVERSRKDRFWGAVLEEDGVLHGDNMLGRLLVELRDVAVAQVEAGQGIAALKCVDPPAIPDCLLLGRPVEKFAYVT